MQSQILLLHSQYILSVLSKNSQKILNHHKPFYAPPHVAKVFFSGHYAGHGSLEFSYGCKTIPLYGSLLLYQTPLGPILAGNALQDLPLATTSATLPEEYISEL